MTVGELKDILDGYDDDKVIYIADPNSRYSYTIDELIDDRGLSSFYGKDKTNVLFLTEGRQVGAMSRMSDLDTEE